MKTTRRAFLQRFGIGLAAAAALAHVPETVLHALPLHEAGPYAAHEYLIARWREYMRGKTAADCPSELQVSHGLYDAFAASCAQLMRADPHLAPYVETRTKKERRPGMMFRTATLRADPSITTWEGLRFVA